MADAIELTITRTTTITEPCKLVAVPNGQAWVGHEVTPEDLRAAGYVRLVPLRSVEESQASELLQQDQRIRTLEYERDAALKRVEELETDLEIVRQRSHELDVCCLNSQVWIDEAERQRATWYNAAFSMWTAACPTDTWNPNNPQAMVDLVEQRAEASREYFSTLCNVLSVRKDHAGWKDLVAATVALLGRAEAAEQSDPSANPMHPQCEVEMK